jgi:hypothetical protein
VTLYVTQCVVMRDVRVIAVAGGVSG